MWEWFQHYWSSVGLGAAIVLLVLALATDTLRGSKLLSRWHDPVWLGWLSAIAYMFHNFEEYGVDALGRAFYFPTTACSTFGFSDMATCPLTPSFFVSVNIPFVWFVLVIAALLARKYPVLGLTGSGLLFTNALSHIATLFTPEGYSPGTLTAAFIFIPLSLWIFFTQFGRQKGRQPISQLAWILMASVLAQVVLLVLLAALAQGLMPLGLAILIQCFDPLLLVVIPLWWQRHLQNKASLLERDEIQS